MGIIGSMLGRRGPGNGFRTIDGGHPAPFPDMTDEQLYNYELAFNVPHKTFDRPPVAHAPVEQVERHGRKEPTLGKGAARARARKAGERVLDSDRFSARASKPENEARREAAPQPDNRQAAGETIVPLDFSRPVRVITTRQPVEIITTRARHPVYKVHGYIGDADVASVFTLDGRLSEHGARFLENVPAARQLFLNIYLNDEAGAREPYRLTQHATQEEADLAAEAGRLRCIAVQLER